MQEKAIIDRIVDGSIAVILVGNDEREYHYPADKLPSEAREGSWLQIQIQDDKIVALSVDRSETESAQKRIQDKMAKLRKRKRT